MVAESLTDTERIPTFYKKTPAKHLEQGDLIDKSSEFVQKVLATYHKYHVDQSGNELFAVLTQSCDLVPHNGSCKARYIAVAPVRSVRRVLSKEFQNAFVRTPGGLISIGSEATKDRFADFVAKLINNNDSRHFYLPAKPELGLPVDYCIMLPLAIAVKVEHYDLCIKGRIAQLDDLFQAKLGWLLGQQYSRVGTPDWPNAVLDDKVANLLQVSQVWLPENDFEQMKQLVQAYAVDKPGVAMTQEDFASLRKKVKNRKDLAIDTIFALLNDLLPPVGPNRLKLRRKLQNDSDFAKFFPNS